MTATQDVIYQEAMSKGQEYQIYLRKYYDTIFDYCFLFDENTGELKLKWHAYMMESSRKRGNAETRGLEPISTLAGALNSLEEACIEYRLEYCKFFRMKTDKETERSDVRCLMQRKLYWEGYPFPEHAIPGE